MEISRLHGDGLEWDAFVRSSKDGTPFHLTAWKRAVEEAFGYRAHYFLARRGGQIHGVLPLFEVPGLLGGRSLISVPYAVYGGLCAADGDARRALVTAAAGLARQRRAAYVELRNREEQGLDLPVKDRYVTFAREIFPDDEANLAAIPRKQRRMVRQGAKHGLRAEFGEAHFDGFYDIYAESVRNLGSPVFPRRLLRGIMEAFDKECQLLTIWRDEQMVAGVLTLLYEDRVLPYYGGARREAFQYAVNDFMYWELMCHAARSGYRLFDFGRSRVGTGSYDFKRHWGFEPRPLPYQYVLVRATSMPDMSPSNPRLHWAVETWKRLPLAVTNVVGPWLTRYTP
jgi:FemAB-related protein (PEP-CTERM system-associated)